MTSPCKDCPNRHPTCHGGCDKYNEWRIRLHEAKRRSEAERYGLWVPSSYAREKAKTQNIKKPLRWN